MVPPQENTARVSAPDFRHVDTWIFDLDNTLYRADSDLFAQIEERMTNYIARTFELTPAEATELQHRYYHSYGSTLSGLVEHHGVDPEEFLCYVHDIDLSVLEPDAGLQRAIARLPGRRTIFTNGCRKHAARVLEQTGLTGLMHEIWDIRTMDFVPKPQPEAYRRIVETAGINPTSAAMFEDMACNLAPAHALGMTTVWINNGSPWSQQGPQYPVVARRHIHHAIDDLGDFLQTIRL